MRTYLRYLGNRRIGGIIIAYTSSNERDSYGNYWTRDTDLGLQRYDRRPLYFQHRGDLVEAGYIQSDDLVVTDRGLYMECDVLDNESGDACLRLVAAGRGHYSTGVMPGSWREGSDGWVELWPWVEASVTDRPATKFGLTRADLVYRSLGQEELMDPSVFLRRGPIWFWSDGDQVSPEAAPVVAPGNGSTAPPAPEQVSASAMVEQLRHVLPGIVREVVRQELAASQPARQLQPAPLPVPLTQQEREPERVPQIQVRHRYDDMSLVGLATWTHLRMQAGKLRGNQVTESVRALVDKIKRQQISDAQITDHQLMRGHRRMIDAEAIQAWGEHLRSDEAMKATYTNYGDELVPTLLNSVLWYYFMVETRVLSALRSFQMPSNPYNYPIITSGATIRQVAELADQTNLGVHNSIIPTSKMGTDDVTFSAGKVGALVIASWELFEDSAVDIAQMWSHQLIRDMASAIDYVLLNGDESANVTNISHYGADPSSTAYDKILILDGLRHIAVGNSDTVEQTSVDADSGVALREVMGARGKYGLDPRKLVHIVDPTVYYDLLGLESIESIADFGDRATLLTGAVGMLKGLPVIVSDELEATNASGQIEDSHDSTFGSHLVVNTEMVLVGWRRQIVTELFKVPGTEGYAVDISARLDLQEMESGGVAYGYNVGGT